MDIPNDLALIKSKNDDNVSSNHFSAYHNNNSYQNNLFKPTKKKFDAFNFFKDELLSSNPHLNEDELLKVFYIFN